MPPTALQSALAGAPVAGGSQAPEELLRLDFGLKVQGVLGHKG